MESFRHAFRNDKDFLKKLPKVKYRTRTDQILQDLRNLSTLSESVTEQLRSINTDFSVFATAESLAGELSGLVAKTITDKAYNRQFKFERNKKYQELKTIVDEIKHCGKHLFKANPSRLIGYQKA